MPIPQFLPSIRDTETVICPRCNTPQYPKNGSCVRCQFSLGVDYLTIPIVALSDACTEIHAGQLARCIGHVLRNLRNRRGICQERMAKLANGIDRSYLSKAENGLALLPLTKLLQLARAMGLTEVILRFDGTKLRAVLKEGRRR